MNAGPAMNGSRALVTGGAGAIGSHVVDALLEAGATEVRVLDLPGARWDANLAAALATGRVTRVVGDVRDRAAVDSAVDGVDLVFHQAAMRVAHCAEDPRRAHETMADGTFHVVHAAAASGVSKLVMASSAAVYGPDGDADLPESARTDRTDSTYAALKAYGEALLRSYGRTLPSVALRYFNVYGPRVVGEGPHAEVLVRWMQRIDANEAPTIDGDGRQEVDLVYVEDVARANVLAATTTSTHRSFNVGTGRGRSLNDVAAALLQAMGSDLAVAHGPPRRINAARRRVADTALAASELGFRAAVPLEDGLARLVDWWSEAGASTGDP